MARGRADYVQGRQARARGGAIAPAARRGAGDKRPAGETRSSQQKQITQILDYASARRCRHKMLAAHLGEQIANCDTGCDQCAPPVRSAVQAIEETRELPDNPGQVIIECLMSFPFNVGRPSLVKALTGSAASNVNPERVKHFGSMPGIVKSSLDAAIDGLIDQGYIVPFKSEEGYKLRG